MSTLRVSNIEAKADASSPTIDEKVKVTDSQGRVLMQIDGKNSGITTIGINTTSPVITVDANQNIQFVGVITAANFNTTGVSTFTRLNVGTGGTIITTTASGNIGIGTNLYPNNEMLVIDSVNGNSAYNTKFVFSGSTNTAYCASTWTHGQSGTAIGYAGVGGSNVGNASFRNTFVVGTQNNTSLVLNTSDAERVRITGIGSVGIGTTNPQAKLHIHGGDAYLSFDRGLYFARENGNTDWSNYIKAANNPDGGYSSTTENNFWVEIGSKGGTHIVLNNDGARDATRNIHDHFTIWQKDSDSTNGARLFAVDNYGQVQFGHAGIRIDRGWDNYACITVQRDNTWGTSNASQAEFRIHGTTQTHAEWVGGASGADFSTNLRIDGATYSSSDKRHKTNIVDNPYGLNEILQLQPRKFNRINSSGEIEENQGDILGFIAQEVKEVIPEAVNYYPNEDTPNEIGWCRAYSLSDSYIVSTLVNAVKEQNEIIESLKSRIEVLESQINT